MKTATSGPFPSRKALRVPQVAVKATVVA